MKVSLLEHRWNRVEPWLAAALLYDRRQIPLEDIKRATLEGRYHLLDGENGAILFEGIPWNGGQLVHIYLAGGSMGELVDILLPRLEAIAEGTGFRGLVITGRKGWRRVLAAHGYQCVGTNELGDTVLVKPLKAKTLKDFVHPMTAINFTLTPGYVAVATDTLVTDMRDWWPISLTPKAVFLPHLDALMTCTGMMQVMQEAYNVALTAPVFDIDALSSSISQVCRRAFRHAFALTRSMHAPEEDMSWVHDGFLVLFGWSPAQGRLIGLRFRVATDFQPELIADGVYTSPSYAEAPPSISHDKVWELCKITQQQQEGELRKTPTDRNAIGGNILLWELIHSPNTPLLCCVQKVHEFSTKHSDAALIAERAHG